MSESKMISPYTTSTRDSKGRELLVEVRADGYFNATKMCVSSKKAWGGYRRNQKTEEFLGTLARNEKLDVNVLVESKVGVLAYTTSNLHSA